MLDRVRPTVVRRRIYEPGPAAPLTPSITHVAGFAPDDDDESGPPSSVNVARALASLRTDELHRLEKILNEDDGEDGERASLPAVPTVEVGPTIAVAELARRMGVPVEDIVTSLVMRGFFSVNVKASLPRETARAAATLFGWHVVDSDESVPLPSPPKRKAKAAMAKRRPGARAPKAKAKVKVKVKLSTAQKAKGQPKPTKRKTGTRAR